jgi:DNA-directed RNA polymerase subunit RPC12/RpoP
MHIVEETRIGYEVECDCGTHFDVYRHDGVAACPHCGNMSDPRRLLFKWACKHDPSLPNPCQAL